MHYYKRNIGDYSKKAARLSILQHGVYTLLMDACYDREQFPTEEDAIEWTWASTPEEIAAVKFVLGKFFKLIDGRYVQNRIQDELNEYHGVCDKNKQTAIAREEERRRRAQALNELSTSRDIESTEREPIVNEVPPNHKPLTKNHKPRTKKRKNKKRNFFTGLPRPLQGKRSASVP